MKVVVIRQFGGPDVLTVTEMAAPRPGVGEVLIEVEAIAVGYEDAIVRRNGSMFGFSEGHIPGGEVAGTVTAVGRDVEDMWIGRRVWVYLGASGGYAEQVIAPVSALIPLATSLSSAQAVAVGISGMVAHFGLLQGRFDAGKSLLVRGAAGPIGIMTVQLAKQMRASTIAVTTSSEQRGARLKALGADLVLDRDGQGGDPSATFDVIIDIVGGAGMPAFFKKLNPNGSLVTLGVVGGFPPAEFGMEMLAAFQKSLSFSTFSANTVPDDEKNRVYADILEMAGRGAIDPVIHDQFPFDQAVASHELLETSYAFGRMVLTPGASR